MADLLALYGTLEPPAEARRLCAGPFSVDLIAGGLRTVRFAGREVLRAVSYVVRDRDRGTYDLDMRQNPYGSRTMPNPDDRRIPMAAADPRARDLFGAAFTVGYAARLAQSTVEAWCGSSFAGPRGLFDRAGRATPLFDVACGLAEPSGRAACLSTQRIAPASTASRCAAWMAAPVSGSPISRRGHSGFAYRATASGRRC